MFCIIHAQRHADSLSRAHWLRSGLSRPMHGCVGRACTSLEGESWEER
jgi:hypothetical protein